MKRVIAISMCAAFPAYAGNNQHSLHFSDPSLIAKAEEFDDLILSRRGFSKEIAERKYPERRFPPGRALVELTINSVRRGRTMLEFNNDGDLCASQELDKFVVFPENATVSCMPLRSLYKDELRINYEPGTQSIVLTIPRELIPKDAAPEFIRGGNATLLNYDAIFNRNYFNSQSRDSGLFLSEFGGNSDEWIFRFRSSYYYNQGSRSKSSLMSGYAQHQIFDDAAIFQAGRIYDRSVLFGSTQFDGIQTFSNNISNPFSPSAGAVVYADVMENEGRVELWSRGQLVFFKSLQAGPFNILRNEIPQVGESSIEVRMITAARTKLGSIPIAALLNPADSTYSFAAGKIALSNKYGHATNFLSTSGTLNIVELPVNLGAQLASGYQGLGAGVSFSQKLWGGTWRIASSNTTASERNGLGLSSGASVYFRPFAGHESQVSASLNNKNYRSIESLGISEALTRTTSSLSYALSHRWQMSSDAVLIANISRSNTAALIDGQVGTSNISVTGSWPWIGGFLSVSATRSKQGNISSNGFFVSYSRSLDAYTRISSNLASSSGRQSVRVQADGQYNDDLTYLVSSSAVRTSGSSATEDATLSGTYKSSVARLGTSISATNDNTRSLMLSASGSVVSHSNGINFSSDRVADTFAIVSLDGVQGVKIASPSGTITTDGSGNAVAAYMTPFSRSTLSIVPDSLPNFVDYQGGVSEFQLARGSAPILTMPLHRVVRVRFSVKQVSLAEAGREIVNSDGEMVAIVDTDGRFVIENYKKQTLFISFQDGSKCRIPALDVKSSDFSFFTEIETSCDGSP